MNTPSPHIAWVSRQLLFADVLTELDAHFRAMGVRYMPIKGSYLILTGLAEKMHARRMQDIDIQVDRENHARVIEYFSRCPCAKIRHDPQKWPFEQPLWYYCRGTEIYVEINYLLNRPERFLLPSETLFARGVKRNGLLYLPSPEDAALILLCHVLAHIDYELRLEPVFEELTITAAQPGFSWTEFWRRAEETGVRDFLAFLVAIYSRRSGTPVPMPRRSIYSRILQATRAESWFEKTPRILRIALWELPFVRDPWALVRIAREERRSWPKHREKGNPPGGNYPKFDT